MSNYAGSANVALRSQTDAQDTITSKSLRIHDKARVLRDRLSEIAGRTLRPSDSKVGGATPEPPTPDHAIFSLESAERYIDEAVSTAEAILGAL